MLFLDVLYYYYYQLYALSKLDNEPTFTARLAITASEAFLLTAIFSILSAYFFGMKFKGYELLVVAIIVFGSNYFFILPPKRVKKILITKPKLFNSDTLSLVVVIFFFVFTTSILFWLNSVVNFIIDNYR